MAKPWKPSLRLYLTGRLTAELGARRVDERRLPGRQGRRALVYLALERARPVPIDELADAVWGTAAGCYQLALPPDAWVDVEAARRALDEAEGHARAGRFRDVWGPANVAASIAARPLPGGVDGEWIERALAAAGNRAEAVRAYGRCKKLLADEPGVVPSPETEAAFKELRARG